LKPVLVFDLVGTLLDLSVLDGDFQSLFGDVRLRREWFSEVQKLFLTSIAVNAYAEFTKVTEAALKVVEQRHGKILGPEDRIELLDKLKKLPPFADVNDGLESLHDAGFTLAVLTNSSSQSAEKALKHAGVLKYFEKLLSADSVQRFKPAAEPYQLAAREFGVGPSSLMLVAAHSWDIAGASRAGCQTCFVRRPEQVLNDLTPRPNLVASDLHDLARHIQSVQAV
jgi:2-haloacid dehalogenase